MTVNARWHGNPEKRAAASLNPRFLLFVSNDLYNLSVDLVCGDVPPFPDYEPEALLLHASGIVDLIVEHRETDNGDPMVERLLKAKETTVGDEGHNFGTGWNSTIRVYRAHDWSLLIDHHYPGGLAVVPTP